MKSFWGALAVFGLMLCMIAFNHFYITRACEELIVQIESLPACEAADRGTAELTKHWGRHRVKFGFSVSKGTIEKITLCTEELAHAARTGDAQLFEGARVRATCLLREIWEAESFLAENWI